MFFDQLSSAARTQKLVKTLFSAVFNSFCSFQNFISDFTAEINKKRLKKYKKMCVFRKKVWNQQKRLKTAEKNCFNQLSGVRSPRKLVEKHNSYLAYPKDL